MSTSLEGLGRLLVGPPEVNQRFYRVVLPEQVYFVLANSPGQAALAVCKEVSTVPAKEVNDALIRALVAKSAT